MTMKGYKVFANDLSAPIQGGAPVWDGTLPYQLPVVSLDKSDSDCGTQGGWHWCREPWTALNIAGLWPRNGRPSRVFEVETGDDDEVVERKDKCRSATLVIVRELPEKEISDAILVISNNLLQPHAEEMAKLQIAWREALRRPIHDEAKVVENLSKCWDGWKPEKFDSTSSLWAARDAWAAWDARDAWAARAVWDAWAARAVWDARAARDAWAARAVWDAWAARAVWDARAARDAWAAWAAWDACIERFCILQGWSKPVDIDRETIRESYKSGALLILPTSDRKLGYVMGIAE